MTTHSKIIFAFILATQPVFPVIAGSSNFSGMSARTQNITLTTFLASAATFSATTKLQSRVTKWSIEDRQKYEKPINFLATVKYTSLLVSACSLCALVGNVGFTLFSSTKA